MKTILNLLLTLALIPVAGAALALTWNWFIVPIFAIPEITLTQAIGVGLFLKVCQGPQGTREAIDKSETFAAADDETRAFAATTVMLASYAAILAVAAIYNAIV